MEEKQMIKSLFGNFKRSSFFRRVSYWLNMMCKNKFETFVFIVFGLCLFAITILDLYPESSRFTFSFIPDEKTEGVNRMISNLSYSYIAGFIFYIFMNLLPARRRKKEIYRIILEYLKLSDHRYFIMLTKICSKMQFGKSNTFEDAEAIKNRIVNNIEYYGNNSYEISKIIPALQEFKEETIQIIDDIRKFDDYLTGNQITEFEKIKRVYLFTSYLPDFIENHRTTCNLNMLDNISVELHWIHKTMINIHIEIREHL